MRKVLIIMLVTAFTVQAVPYYSTPGNVYAGSGPAWNSAADGSGNNGSSASYKAGVELHLQAGSKFISKGSYYASSPWDASAYYWQGATLALEGGASVNFTGGDINFTAASTILSGGGTSLGGTSTAHLNGNTLTFSQTFSGANGALDFNLNIVGSGSLDLSYSNSALVYNFNALNENFTGNILGDKFHGTVHFKEGDGAINTGLILARDATADGKLDLDGMFSVSSLKIENVVFADGAYNYAELLAVGSANGKNFADNLVNNGGKIFIGQVVSGSISATPEPASYALLIIGICGLFSFGRHQQQKPT